MTKADLDASLTEAATLLSRSGIVDRSELVEVPVEHYALGDEIARGGMGRISTARDLRSGRVVAIKEVLAEVIEVYPEAEREEVLARFCREAILTARLEHPSIVPVYEVGRFGDAPFFAMKRVTGDPLSKHMSEAESFEERLALLPKLAAVADAIAYAHDRGVIHRDLKPNNILVGEFGETLVIDWGLAKDIGSSEEVKRRNGESADVTDSIDETLEGSVIGTPQYMPPEQAEGAVVDRRADVYAVGAILYHALAGQPPYPIDKSKRGNPIADVLRRVQSEPPTPIGELAPAIPADLLSIVEKAMAREPDKRYADAGELATDLASFQRGQLVAVHDYSAAELLGRWLRRHKATVVTAAVLATALLAAVVWFVLVTRAARDEAMAGMIRADEAIDRWVSMFEQRGRAELARGDVATAALILSEAYQHKSKDLGVAMVLAEALRGIEPLKRVSHLGDNLRWISAHRDRIVSIDLNGQLSVFAVGDDTPLSRRAIDIPWLFTALEDGRLVLGYPNRVVVLDHEGNALIEISSRERLNSVAALGAKDVVAIGTNRGRVTVHSIATGAVIGTQILNPEWDSIPAFPIGALAFDSRTAAVLATTPLAVVLYETHALETVRWKKPSIEAFVTARFSPSRDRLVLGSRQARAVLVKAMTGDIVETLDGHTGAVSAEFDPTGARVASHGQTSTRLWDGETGRLISTFPGWRMETTTITADPTGEKLAIGSREGVIQVVDFATGRLRARLVGHAEQVTALAFTGETLVSASSDGTVKLWDGNADLRTKVSEIGSRYSLHVGAERMHTFSSTGAIVWDVATRTAIAEIPAATGRTASAALSFDRRLLGTATGLFDARTGAQIASFDIAAGLIMVVNNDGMIATLDDPRSVTLRDRQGALIRTFKLPAGYATQIRFSPDGRRILYPRPGRLESVDIETLEVKSYISRDVSRSAYPSFDFSSDGQRVAVSSEVEGTRLWDLATGELLASTPIGAPTIDYAPDRDLIAIRAQNRLTLWNPNGKTIERRLAHEIGGGNVRFSPTGRTVVTNGFTVRVWETTMGEILLERETGSEINHAYITDKDRLLVTKSSTAIGFWEIPPETRDPDVTSKLVAEGVPRDFEPGRGVISRPVPAAR